MTIGDNISEFFGLKVEIYSEQSGISDPENTAYKLMVDYDEVEENIKITDKFKSFINDPKAGSVKALVIGSWEESFENSPDKLLELMIENVDKLTNLKALFVGEMTFEECEMSWIIQTDYTQFLNTFSNLELFRVRGTSNFNLGTVTHNTLKSLTIESGGLQTRVIDDLLSCNLPDLNHLELWLGTDDYGFDGDISTIKKLIESNPFPKLSYLGLRNSEIADDIAVYLADNAILDQIDTLDLSLGTLSDKGAKALLAGSKVKSLKKLDLHFHYMTNDMMTKFETLGIPVDVSDQQEDDEYDDDDESYRYVYVSE